MMTWWWRALLVVCCARVSCARGSGRGAGRAEHLLELEVSELAPVGTRIGFIGDGAPDAVPPFHIVPLLDSAAVDSDLVTDEDTGEIRTRAPLDHETRAAYNFVAILPSNDNLHVRIKVLDENDNAPQFPAAFMHIEFPENTPRDVKRTLLPARDLDLGVYNTQRYNIVSGNVNNTFRLSSHRESDGVLYLDLQINGFLDRETTPEYSLIIEALDGGTPPLRGQMTVNITIQDVNDNPPVFNQSRYFATVPENATVGTTVLQVFASDLDAGENGQVEYSINRRQSDRDSMFRIHPSTGLIVVNKPLDFETKELHELVIVAKDHGLQPLETTAFVSIRVTDVNDNQPQINVIFLSDDATPKISESAQPGEFVARISVHDPDSKTEYSNINVTLSGGDGHFGLTTRDNIIYLVIVSLPLDREIQPNYTLSVVATDTGTPPLHASRTIHLRVTDINDNSPEFSQPVYHGNVMEVSDPGTSVVQVSASDRDEGNNSAVTYSLVDTPDTHSQWFAVDARSGLVTTRTRVDCETEPVPRLTVLATDSGFPPLSSTATVLVTIHDVNDNEPIFDQSFYNVSVAENEPPGRCILKVSATDPDCGVNAMVNYTIGEGFGKIREFEVRSGSGEVCIVAALDYEARSMYEFPVVATDRGGLSTTAMVKIQLTDVNDNRPVFYPREYNVSLREGGLAGSAVAVVAATDLDSGRFGVISYRLVAGNEAGLFRVDRTSGELFVSRPSLLSARAAPHHRLKVSAIDGAGLRAEHDAEIYISVVDAAQRPPIFQQNKYSYSVREDALPGATLGTVQATVSDSGGWRPVRYSIYSGDPDGYFSIDRATGALRTAAPLDHEARASLLLNVQATAGDPPTYGHTQVNIDILDVNDNPPEFESSTVRISVPENVDVGVPLYAAHARDRDSGAHGEVRYRLGGGGGGGGSTQPLFAVEPRSGYITLTRRLDYETQPRHSLVVTASDLGQPPLEANLTVLVEVQDVNDNVPVFEQKQYTVKVLETMPVNSQILEVTAVDLDTGNNARLTYRLIPSTNTSVACEELELFGIFPNSGWIYLRGALDREHRDRYDLTVAAIDNGTPSETASTQVTVLVLDANDNDPKFAQESYEFSVEENLRRGAIVGFVSATDADMDVNAIVKYSLIPGNTSFHINPVTGEIVTRESLDREAKATYDLIAEARDQGTPSRSSRVSVRIQVTDVNDNAPIIVDPQEDVVSVREEQPPGTEVVRIRAIDSDNGYNASITYSILKGRDSDGYGMFTIDPMSGVIRTRLVLDHEERAIYRLAVAATDSGKPPRQTIRLLRVEVLDLNDNRPTFTSSSLVFSIREDVRVGHVVGLVATSDSTDNDNLINSRGAGHITYTLTSLTSDHIAGAFDIDRSTGSLVVARQLDRETQSEYRLEVRALDTSAMNNPQSSAVTVRVNILDANDNAPKWSQDPVTIPVAEDTIVGSSVYNFTATDADSGPNGEIRYTLVKSFPDKPSVFNVDILTGTLTLLSSLDYETLPEYTLIVKATDQSKNISERLSTSVTARIIVTDSNDNAPKFVFPTTPIVNVNSGVTVGMVVSHLVAVDTDSGDNGRVTYVISGGNEDGRFSLGYDTGILTLGKSIISEGDENESFYTLNITASDHGTPTNKAHIALKLHVPGSLQHPPRFLNSVYQVKVPEDTSVGSFVVKVSAKATLMTEGNLSYYIPSGVADDLFTIDAKSGIVTTRGALDREKTDEYTIPIYVSDTTGRQSDSHDHNSQFDVAMLTIEVTDVNDHAPEFKPGACYPLLIPENGEIAVIHRVVAMDLDSGINGEITYSISAGNIGNKFSIDAKTGELSAKSLDRETQYRYMLTITAQDRGRPIYLQGSCNISIRVDDENDNDPKFDSPRYTATISEDATSDTSILRVHATDADIGLNARIIYSLANESHWLFRIDNKTGIITTAGQFDREKKSSYEFLVVATDQGKYDARLQKVPVKITVADVNDNKPMFSRYPFKEKIPAYLQPGQTLLQVSATDEDIGINSEIVYSLHNEPLNSKFRINPNSGVLTASQSLASENGKIIYLHVSATDKGNPPRSSIGLVEISVGDVPISTPRLRFQNATYTITLSENTPQSTEVIQLSAVRSDGRRQRVTYSFGRGNEGNAFSIDSDSGRIWVRDPTQLDYERNTELRLVVEAKADGSPTLYGYCNLTIQLTDQNDNSPKFTQQQYSASVWEGNNKGTFVMQIAAFDEDQGQNSRVLYHIVDGNHDNAFIIEPAFSGVVKTNIVLDREIRDTYRLTVIATDKGVPQMTGTARIRINIVDVNDNQPTFPPHSVITVSEGTEVGTVLTSMTANDVDTYPILTYSFSLDNDADNIRMFSIDRFTGKIILSKSLDYETQQEYQLKVTASDTAHTANTMLTIRVTDVNDNAPVFQQPAYHALLPDGRSDINLEVLRVNASDADSGDNSRLRYSLLHPVRGFSISEVSGIIYVNQSELPRSMEDAQMAVVASDFGNPVQQTVASVRIKVNSGNGIQPYFANKEYKVRLSEDSPKGTTVVEISPPEIFGSRKQSTHFFISDGNEDGNFAVANPNGVIMLIRSLDREVKDSYTLHLVVSESGVRMVEANASKIIVHISVDDINDNAPVFQQSDYEVTISEATPVTTSVVQIIATDSDQPGTPRSEIIYDITSGNDLIRFDLDPTSGVLSVKNPLDYDNGIVEHNLVVRACDQALNQLCSLTSIQVILQDENDNAPRFPVTEYLEFVGENEPIGTAIFSAHATDLDKGVFGMLNYSITSATSTGYGGIDESWKLFRVDPSTGLVTTAAVFDYEQRNRYVFTLRASDFGGRIANVKVRVEIESRDEFHPQFTERTYRFILATPSTNHLPVGYVIGHVTATDRDKGPDGRVVYQLTTQHPYFKMNRTTGAVTVKKKLDNAAVTLDTSRDISLVVTASSGRQGSLTNMTVVEIILDPLADPGTNLANSYPKYDRSPNNSTAVAAASGGLADWALGLLIALVLVVLCFGGVFLYLHMRNRRNKIVNKPNLSAPDSVASTNNYVDPSAFDTIPIRGGGNGVGVGGGGVGQFAPPKYDEIPPYGPGPGHHAASSNSGAATTSELSGSEQSGSSGRGSAEDGDDGDDEEIRMINEGPLQRDSGIIGHRNNDVEMDDDNLSDVSVHNTQEYLARLGIVNAGQSASGQVGPGSKDKESHHSSVPVAMDAHMHMFDEEGAGEPDITNLIYAKLQDVGGGSERASSADEGAVAVLAPQPSMNGSLSSIVHSEEELTGSYNWDYLLDWGPQYQPLAHVFSEIARLKDDSASVASAASGGSSVKSKGSGAVKTVPPPLLTNVAPRALKAPASSHHTVLPRSPISHDSAGAAFAMSPSFSPSLSPLATKSPSISPLVAPGLPVLRQATQPRQVKTVVEAELRI